MAQQQIHNTKSKLEKAVLVGVHAQDDKQFNSEFTMEELSSLSETCRLEVLGQITQNRDRVDRRYYVGKGRIEEIQAFIEFRDTDVVIMNNELTTAQSESLSEALGVEIIDRTQLVLEIFALRARGKEGKLRVGLAQLDYLLPRLQGHGKSLSHLGGGIGTRGPGETRLEMDRRHVRTRMNEIKRQLRTVEEHRERYRSRRNQSQMFRVALVGYTNAGKSPWFNVLANEETYGRDQLFITLDPRTQQIQINDGFNLIVSGTIGFIQRLPTMLVAAFKPTLEGVKGAGLLIHAVDNSHPEYRTQYNTVNDLIKQLDMSHISQMVIFNKEGLCDRASDHPTGDLPNVFVPSKNDGDKLLARTLFIDGIKRQLIYYNETIATNNTDRLCFLKQHTLMTRLKYDEVENVYRIKGFKK